jgi:GTP-binding protein EngB required for normal cell division
VGVGKSTIIGESTSGKSSAIGMILGDATEVRMGNTYGQGESGR